MIVVLFEQSVDGETVRLVYLVLDQKWDPTQAYTWAHHIQSSEYSQKGRQQVTLLSLRNLSKPSKETEHIDPRSVRLHSSGSQHCHLLVLASRFLLQFFCHSIVFKSWEDSQPKLGIGIHKSIQFKRAQTHRRHQSRIFAVRG